MKASASYGTRAASRNRFFLCMGLFSRFLSTALRFTADYFTGTTSTATASFCFREPTMMPSTGETSEKSRPTARMM
jgi:hypothetical protein